MFSTLKWFCVFSSLFLNSSTHSPLILCVCVYVCVLMFTHTVEALLAFKQMYNDSTWRGPVIWASEPRMSLVSTCVEYSSRLFFPSFFSDLSIKISASCHKGVTGGPCEFYSEIDRQVGELIVVQDTSSEAQRYSSYTMPASSPLRRLSLLARSRPSFIHLQIAFSPMLVLLESWDACGISLDAPEKFLQYWFGLKNPAGSTSGTWLVTRPKKDFFWAAAAHPVSRHT